MRFIKQPAGASQEELVAVEEKFGVRLPADLRAFWLSSNGPIIDFKFKELQFFALSEIEADIYELGKNMPGSLPICMDGKGNLCLLRISSSKAEGYYVANCGNLGWDESKRIANDFIGFLADDISPEARLHA